jgi:hypothetical protein
MSNFFMIGRSFKFPGLNEPASHRRRERWWASLGVPPVEDGLQTGHFAACVFASAPQRSRHAYP